MKLVTFGWLYATNSAAVGISWAKHLCHSVPFYKLFTRNNTPQKTKDSFEDTIYPKIDSTSTEAGGEVEDLDQGV